MRIDIPIIEDFKIRRAKPFGNGNHITLPKHWSGAELICFHLSNPKIEMNNNTLSISINGVKKGYVKSLKSGGAHILIPKSWENDILIIKMENYIKMVEKHDLSDT